jgi:hypothetical protein
MSVNEYVTKFAQLSCYAPHEVHTNERTGLCFEGLGFGEIPRDGEHDGCTGESQRCDGAQV